MHIYIYIYICREREREIDRSYHIHGCMYPCTYVVMQQSWSLLALALFLLLPSSRLPYEASSSVALRL